MKDIVLLGAPGCGKGTQAELILKYYPDIFSHISTGDVFRALTSSDNAIGRYLKARLESGKLIDDMVTISIFDAYFFSVLDEGKGMLLDGYPRSMKQFEGIWDIAQKHKRNIVGLYFELPEEETINRILKRGREGENHDVIKQRLDEYYKHTQPILDAFDSRFKLIKIDATLDVQGVFEQVKKAIS